MKRSSSISRTFFRRPAVRELVPDLRLLLVVMTVGCESHAGVWRPAGLPEETGLEVGAVDGGLADLERRGHILRDRGTAEVFLRAWYRDNVFKGPARWGQWLEDLKQIESPRLRAAVLEAIAASPECGLSPQNVDNSKETQTNQQTTSQGQDQDQDKARERGAQGAPGPRSPGGGLGELNPVAQSASRYQASPSGVVYQAGNVRDEAALASISSYPLDAVAAAVTEAAGRDKAGCAWASGVLAILRASPDHQPPPQLATWAIAAQVNRRTPPKGLAPAGGQTGLP